MQSLRARLLVLWGLSAAACIVAYVLLSQSAAQSTAAQAERAEAVVARACNLIQERYDFYKTDWSGPAPPFDDRLRGDLRSVVIMALLRQHGVEGGIWQTDAGPLATAFPTYQGVRPRADPSPVELDQLRALNEAVAHDEQATARRWTSSTQTMLIQACPLDGPIGGLTAWAMTRLSYVAEARGFRIGLTALLILMLAITAWLAWLLVSWSRRVGRLEAMVAGASGATLPPLAPIGDPDLDRIVMALNVSARRLAEARAQVTTSERLAALGRVAAGVAHEIRNPIATIRLRAENALASSDAERRDRALHSVLDQVARLDRLSVELLAMTQRRVPDCVACDLSVLVQGCADDFAEATATASIVLEADGNGTAWLDPALIRRALDNLVVNAIRHTPAGGRVSISAKIDNEAAVLVVADTGPGVAAGLRESLFEPFASGRPDGTGLGLAIVRELVQAHGGSITLDPASRSARFVVTLPQPSSAIGSVWPRS